MAIAERMLSSLGLEEGDLACGPHEPLSVRGAKVARELNTPIQIGENFASAHEMHAALKAEACDLVMPDAQLAQSMPSICRVMFWSGWFILLRN